MLKAPEHPSRALYFVNGWLDTALIGGVSILAFLGLRAFTNGDAAPSTIQFVAVMSVFVNYPHFSATVYRLYQNPANIRQFPVTALVVPVVLLGAIAASLWQPDFVAPYFVTLFLIWSPYHYSGQTIGITMLYGRRSGFEIGRWQRIALSAFVFSTFIVSFAHPRNVEPIVRYGVTIPVIHFPPWLDAVMIALMCAGAALFLFFVVQWCRTRRAVLPPIVLLPALAQFIWFLPGKQTEMFYEFVPMFHGLQYLYIAWAMQLGLRMAQPNNKQTPSIFRETIRWALRNYAGGILLFILFPWLLFWVHLPMVTVAGIVAAAINIHHFFVDGVIWKLRNANVASPLMMNVADWGPHTELVAAE